MVFGFGRLLGGFSGLMLACSPAAAWGGLGHKVVAALAQERLTPNALSEVERLLQIEGDTKLASVASWADQIRDDGGLYFHSIRTPMTGAYSEPPGCDLDKCVLTFYNRQLAVLSDKTASDADRLTALKYVVHLVGDFHQPLHTSVETGKELKVSFNGKAVTLHHFWDSDALESENLSYQALTKKLENAADNVKEATDLDALDWAYEGRTLVENGVVLNGLLSFDKEDATPITQPYYTWSLQIMHSRIAQAGVRLANTLNEALKS